MLGEGLNPAPRYSPMVEQRGTPSVKYMTLHGVGSVSDVTVSTDQIFIYGPKAALENGVANGVPRLEGTVPIFDRKWCQKRKSYGRLSD